MHPVIYSASHAKSLLWQFFQPCMQKLFRNYSNPSQHKFRQTIIFIFSCDSKLIFLHLMWFIMVIFLPLNCLRFYVVCLLDQWTESKECMMLYYCFIQLCSIYLFGQEKKNILLLSFTYLKVTMAMVPLQPHTDTPDILAKGTVKRYINR